MGILEYPLSTGGGEYGKWNKYTATGNLMYTERFPG